MGVPVNSALGQPGKNEVSVRKIGSECLGSRTPNMAFRTLSEVINL